LILSGFEITGYGPARERLIQFLLYTWTAFCRLGSPSFCPELILHTFSPCILFKNGFCHVRLCINAAFELMYFYMELQITIFAFKFALVVYIIVRYDCSQVVSSLLVSCKQLLASITGTQKISIPITIAVSGIAKVFVGEVVETGRLVFL